MSHPNILEDKERLKKVSSILISQPEPDTKDAPYDKLVEKYNVKVDYRPFIKVEPVPYKEFRSQKIDILSHTAIILTSRNAVDNFFRICNEAKIEVPSDMKYFCVSEQTANYLQKYIVIRKRKIFVGGRNAQDLIEVLKKHKDEKFLFPCSNIRKNDIPDFLSENGYDYTEAVIYNTVPRDLSDLRDVNYDIIAFFSPSGIDSLLQNFPDFKQGKTRIAAFGPTTAQAVRDAGLTLDIMAPMPDAPSMAGALEYYIQMANQGKNGK